LDHPFSPYKIVTPVLENVPVPDFICIGAPRSGTTWLFERLLEHPDFWLPPVKEVHYFDRSPHYPSPNTLAETKLVSRLRQPIWLLNALSGCAHALLTRGPRALRWQVRWFFSDYTDEWYLSLFEGVVGITGEITPAYSILAPEDVARLHSLIPRAKIIYLLRNPVERSWSSYRKERMRHGAYLADKDILSFLASKAIANRSDYISTIDRYVEQFGHENVIVSTYDALRSEPSGMLTQIVALLGGRPELVERYCDLGSVNNTAPSAVLPMGIKDALLEWYRPTIEELTQRYGNPFGSWGRMETPHWDADAKLVFHP
jgi:hypothetical protein